MKLRSFEDVAKLPSKARGKDGSMSKVYARGGEASMRLQRFDQAMQQFERSLKLDPENERAQAGRERAAKRLSGGAAPNGKRAAASARH
jgi:Tfp pilus assembly protein PilF